MKVKVAGIAGTVAIVAISVAHGLDGVIIASGMAIVAVLSGYEIGVRKRGDDKA